MIAGCGFEGVSGERVCHPLSRTEPSACILDDWGGPCHLPGPPSSSSNSNALSGFPFDPLLQEVFLASGTLLVIQGVLSLCPGSVHQEKVLFFLLWRRVCIP